ncbi:sulfatase-like hydrolase/transferase [Candidatus Laterigemmans baculatus]|uniref:sulfatase-like hydrolase/transferase n=1 Tax=Candidatus Laterigemmans baculatus TaxID=2770505 RepID=UPI0013DD503A|nr:sulfatase-like hydrolase/transferase [Candidatus Laterigemmans baculatus]
MDPSPLRFPWLLLGVALAGPFVSPAAAAAPSRSDTAPPPNIVLIVSDDQGYADLGCFGSDEAITPHLDRLASAGVRLTNFYVSWPACTPSRGSLLTGRYPQRNGIYDMIRNEAPDYGHRYSPEEYAVTFERIGGMDTREVLLPEMLKAAGYTSGIYGKWDLGVHHRYLPLQRGFDDFYGFCNTGIDYYTHERYGVPSMYRDNEPTEEDKGTYCTELFLREATRFVDEHHDSPFFLYLPFNAPHGASSLDPLIRSGAQGPEEAKAFYPELQAKAGTTQAKRYGEPATVRNAASRRLEYLAAVTAMDAAIGKVLDQLEEYGIADNTIVIFFSDNGGSGSSDNGPLRGKKSWMFEGGIRVPAIVRYPKQIPADTTCDEFLTSLEVLPTLLAAAGLPAPTTEPATDRPAEEIILDGYDMLPTLAGKTASPRTEMYWQRRGDMAARVGDWKWVDSARGRGLFNLAEDIGERNDLSKKHPEKLQQLKAAHARWQAEMVAAEPRGPFKDF